MGRASPPCCLFQRTTADQSVPVLQGDGRVWRLDGKGGLWGRDPFNQNSDRSDREKWSTSKFIWTSVFETFPVGPNRSIEFWSEIYGHFGWMNGALDLSIFIFNFPILNFPSTPPPKIKKLRNQKFNVGAKVFLFSSFRFLSKYFGFGTNTQSWTPVSWIENFLVYLFD